MPLDSSTDNRFEPPLSTPNNLTPNSPLFRSASTEDKPAGATESDADIMPLGDWETGLGHLLAIIKISFTALHTHIKMRPAPIPKSAMSLNLASSDVSMASNSSGSLGTKGSRSSGSLGHVSFSYKCLSTCSRIICK